MERVNADQIAPKLRLLCIEGPAGSGKTTLCDALFKTLHARGITCCVVDEFSTTPLGQELRAQLSRFSHTSVTWSAIETMMLCVADKFTSVSFASKTNAKVILLDRGFITQFALAIPYVSDPDEKAHAEVIVGQLNKWLAGRFDVTTIVLQIPKILNIRRLERRLGRYLNEDEKQILTCEIESYADLKLCPNSSGLGLRYVDAQAAPDQLAVAVVAEFMKIDSTI